MAQFVPIGGGVHIQPRIPMPRDRSPSAAEMLALMMQTDNQDRMSATEALALVLPLVQGAMSQQAMMAQLKQQGDQFSEKLSFERGEAERAYELARGALERQPTSEQRIAELRAAQEPALEQLKLAAEEARQRGDIQGAQLAEMKYMMEVGKQDRALMLTSEAAGRQAQEISEVADVARESLSTSELERGLSRESKTDEAMAATLNRMRLADESRTVTGDIANFLAGDPGALSPADQEMARALDLARTGKETFSTVTDPFALFENPDDRQDQLAWLKVVEGAISDPEAASMLSSGMRKRASRFLTSDTAQRLREEERERDRAVREQERKIAAKAREDARRLRERGRQLQQDVIANPNVDVASILRSIGDTSIAPYEVSLLPPEGFVGPPGVR